MIIDFHTHLFPDAIAARALSRLVDNTRPYTQRYGETRPHTDATAAGLTASARAAGIDVSVVMPIATSPRPSETINTFAAEVDRLPGLRSFGSVHPRCPDAFRELERIRQLGLRGIKLHPEYQGCFADAPETVAVVKRAGELGLWVLLHAGEDIGMPPPVHCAPEHAVRLCEAAPEARIIFAHMGGYRQWQEAERILPGSGAYVDTSFCLPNHPEEWERFALLARALGADHVLFGTDSPWADQAQALACARRFFDQAGFTGEEREAMLGGNAAAILAGAAPRPESNN